MSVNNVTINFSSSVSDFSVSRDNNLSFEQHNISNICKETYPELRRICSIRHYVSIDATKLLICSCVFLRLDYCNSLLAGLQKTVIEKLKRIQNDAANLVFQTSRNDSVSALVFLCWLWLTPVPV